MSNIVQDSSLSLANWRRNVAEMYMHVRNSEDSLIGWQNFVAARNKLFKNHAQSPLSTGERSSFRQLRYYPYEPALRLIGHLDYSMEPEEITIQESQGGLFRIRRFATVHFKLSGKSARLSIFSIRGYGGGVFLPFKDQTNQTTTFNGGRYLYDTIKGADLGAVENEILLDFNFAYNPSCAYNAQWICPLAPPENTLNMSITAGEKRFLASDGD